MAILLLIMATSILPLSMSNLKFVAAGVEIVAETEMFAFPISPNMFNWTYQEFENQFVFQTSIANKPDLPKWLRYVYSMRHSSGFVYGTPPKDQQNIELDVVALNRLDYSVRRITIPLQINRKTSVARYEVQMKIDNLNVEDMLDDYRVEKIKDIFRRKLWRESANDLYVTFLASAVDLGARLPLKPTEGEGIFLRLGSTQPHSPELLQLQEEVKPLFRLTWCPRDFKRTTVERLFRDAGFNLDWCSFRLVEIDYEKEKSLISKIDSYHQTEGRYHSTKHISNTAIPTAIGNIDKFKTKLEYLGSESVMNRWKPPKKSALPQRSYIKEFTLAILIPMTAMILSIVILTVVLCFQYVGGHKMVSKVQLCPPRSGHTPGGVTDQSNLTDNMSNKSTIGVSPNNSLSRPYSPRSNPNLSGNYNRPQPPPYLGSNPNATMPKDGGRQYGDNLPCEASSLGRRQHNRVLEESLKLLNEANIANRDYNHLDKGNHNLTDEYLTKDPILDHSDGSDDYVPIRRDNDNILRQNGGPKVILTTS